VEVRNGYKFHQHSFSHSTPLVTASLSECRLYQILKWDYIQNLDINRKTYVFYVQGKCSVITNKAVTQKYCSYSVEITFKNNPKKSKSFIHQQMHYLIILENSKIYIKTHIKVAPTCFGSRPSSGSLYLSLSKVTLMLKQSVKLRRYVLCGGVAACIFFVFCQIRFHKHSLQINSFKDKLITNRISWYNLF
jgi:hypothetical protein